MHSAPFPVVVVVGLLFGPLLLSILFYVFSRRYRKEKKPPKKSSRLLCLLLCALAFGLSAHSQTISQQQGSPTRDEQLQALQKKVEALKAQLDDVTAQLNALSAQPTAHAESIPPPGPALSAAPPAPEEAVAAKETKSLLPASSTLNVTFDGYYGYNLNHPVGRVNSLRAYDVLSNSFSLNQAAVIFELPTDPANGRRFGARVDLQFGQATASLQGNPANENRPEVYRNIFQAYGRAVAPLGKGVTIDFGKWASSLGYEGTYTKDQLNYTRSFFFYFLPFYHMGFRTSYQVNDKLALNYWIVNGTQQSEPTNSFKDEMFGFNLTPTKTVSWTFNYYIGQEHPDAIPSTTCGSAPLQPGLCFTPIPHAPDGKLHIFDTYLTWQATPRLLFVGETDYVIQREWATAGPGRSSAPTHVDGGVLYGGYQFTPASSLAVRGEYLSDRGGMFSGTTQALKEGTATFSHHFSDNFEALLEYRRDWSNRGFFPRGNAGALVNHQDTGTLGLVWWYGGKQGAW